MVLASDRMTLAYSETRSSPFELAVKKAVPSLATVLAMPVLNSLDSPATRSSPIPRATLTSKEPVPGFFSIKNPRSAPRVLMAESMIRSRSGARCFSWLRALLTSRRFSRSWPARRRELTSRFTPTMASAIRPTWEAISGEMAPGELWRAS